LTQIVDGKVEASKLSAAFEDEMKVVEREHHAAVDVFDEDGRRVTRFGIVAAVLGSS